MRVEFAEQYSVCCLVIDVEQLEPLSSQSQDLLEEAWEKECTYHDGEEELICARFPNRPQEVYTESAFTRSIERLLKTKDGQ